MINVDTLLDCLYLSVWLCVCLLMCLCVCCVCSVCVCVLSVCVFDGVLLCLVVCMFV